MLWSNTSRGFLLFLTKIERNPFEVVSDSERCGLSNPEELHASMALSSKLNERANPPAMLGRIV